MKRKEQKTRMQSVKRAVAMAIHAARETRAMAEVMMAEGGGGSGAVARFAGLMPFTRFVPVGAARREAIGAAAEEAGRGGMLVVDGAERLDCREEDELRRACEDTGCGVVLLVRGAWPDSPCLTQLKRRVLVRVAV